MVRVHATGSPCLVGDVGTVATRALGPPQGVALFVLLAVEHRRAVPVSEIADHLWPTGSPDRTELAVRSLVSKLRRALPDPVTIGSGLGCYQLRLPPGAGVDVEDCLAAVEVAEHRIRSGAPAAAGGAALVAASIARHNVLPTWPSEWAAVQRRRLMQARVRALDCLSEFFLQAGDAAQAARVGEQVIDLEPYRESSYRRLMRAHAALGNPAEAALVYQRLCTRLLAELDVAPAAETTAVLHELTRG